MLRAVLMVLPAVVHGRPGVDLDFAALNAAGVGGDGVLLGPARGAWPLMPPRSAQRFPPERYAPRLRRTVELPESYDWRDTPGMVTPVQDQGSVGSCWAFSATGNVEGQAFVATNVSTLLSTEFLVDCDDRDCSVFGG